jgi:hypothetical protein
LLATVARQIHNDTETSPRRRVYLPRQSSRLPGQTRLASLTETFNQMTNGAARQIKQFMVTKIEL